MEERNEKSKKEETKEKRKNEEKKERQLCNPVTFCLTSKEDFALLQVIHLCTCYEISIVSKLIACTGKERMASWLLYGYFTKLMRQQMIFNPIKKTKHSFFSTLKKIPMFLVLGLDDMILQFRESAEHLQWNWFSVENWWITYCQWLEGKVLVYALM